jgi:hypothetical protein
MSLVRSFSAFIVLYFFFFFDNFLDRNIGFFNEKNQIKISNTVALITTKVIKFNLDQSSNYRLNRLIKSI